MLLDRLKFNWVNDVSNLMIFRLYVYFNILIFIFKNDGLEPYSDSLGIFNVNVTNMRNCIEINLNDQNKT